jgi:hypothetical protein
MSRYCLAFSLLLFLCFPALAVKAEGLKLNKELVSVLNDFNPSFKIWESKDYSKTIQKNAEEKKTHPYYLSFDVNSDGKPDLVLDGRDGENNILLCLVSGPKGYKVEVLRISELVEPAKLEAWNDGIKEEGLNYYMWPASDGRGFTLGYPQQSNDNINILIDGEMIDYIFKDGEFSEFYQTL